MTPHFIRDLLAAMIVLMSLVALRGAARAYGAGRPWKGSALMGAGFLQMGVVGLTTESGSTSGGILTIAAAALVLTGSMLARRERKLGGANQ